MFDQKHMNAAISRIVHGSKATAAPKSSNSGPAFAARMAGHRAAAAQSRASSTAPPSAPAKRAPRGTHGKVKVQRVPDLVPGPGVTVPGAHVGPGPGETPKNLKVVQAQPTVMPKPAKAKRVSAPSEPIGPGPGRPDVHIHVHLGDK